MKAVRLNNRLIAYQHRPTLGRTIVFANSLGSNQSIWDEVMSHLPKGYGIVTYDLPGHGLSSASPQISIEDMAADAIALIEYLDLTEVVFCGLSIGGMIGQVVAAQRPDLIARAILCHTSSKIGTWDKWTARIEAAEADGLDSLAPAILANWFGTHYCTHKADHLPLHENMIRQTTKVGYIAACQALRAADLTALAAKITVPVLCIGGDEDQSVALAEVKELSRDIPQAQFEVMTGVGHLPCLEAPQALATLIEGFEQSDQPEQGLSVRRKVLGAEHVARAQAQTTPFDAAFQDLITQGAWGTVWQSPGLSHRDRSLLTLTLLAALGNFDEIPMHIRATARTGAKACEVAEAFQQVAIYAGVPRANHALKLAKATFAEMEAEKDD